MQGETKHSYGRSSNLFVSRKASGESIVMGGTAEDSTRWTRVLSKRAAQMLWFHLAQILYPDKADYITGMISTTPIRSTDMPTITAHMTVDTLENGGYEIVGWINNQTWDISIEAAEAQRFWIALDIALNPAGTPEPPAKPTPPTST
jgi:hypothetical protein